MVCDGHMIVDIIFFISEGKIFRPVIESFDKVPDHLGYQVGGLAIPIQFGIRFIKSDGSQLIADPGISHDLAGFLSVKTIWCGISVSGRV